MILHLFSVHNSRLQVYKNLLASLTQREITLDINETKLAKTVLVCPYRHVLLLGSHLGCYFRQTKPGSYLNEWGERQNFPFKGHLDIKAGHLYNNNFFDELIRRGTTSPPTPKVFKTAMNLTPVSATTRLADILLVWLLPLAFGGRRGGMCQATATSWSWISLAKMT